MLTVAPSTRPTRPTGQYRPNRRDSERNVVYLMFDCEMDGPKAGIGARFNSLLSVACVAFQVTEGDPHRCRIVSEFSHNIQPLPENSQDARTLHWLETEQPRAYSATQKDARPAAFVFGQLAAWLSRIRVHDSVTGMPVLGNLVPMSSRSNCDFAFLNVYFHMFVGRNPLGHTFYDMNTFLWALSGTASPRTYWRLGHLGVDHHDDAYVKPHVALDDARAQARLFAGVLFGSGVPPAPDYTLSADSDDSLEYQ